MKWRMSAGGITYTPVHASEGASSHVSDHSVVLYRKVTRDVSFRDMESAACRSRHDCDVCVSLFDSKTRAIQ